MEYIYPSLSPKTRALKVRLRFDNPDELLKSNMYADVTIYGGPKEDGIIKTRYPGQAPRVVEDQVTYPLTTAMLSVPGAIKVRGFSFFGDSYVFVIFEDGTDIYWARLRVLEYLSQVTGRLPPGATPAFGPDATGVGWIYEYALVDRTGQYDLAQLRALQDWFLKYELQTVAGVAEVATVGGMVKQYQVVLDPDRLRPTDCPWRGSGRPSNGLIRR